MKLTLREIADWTQGTVEEAYESVAVSGFSTDSRKTAQDMMFIPIVGERFDGHSFIESLRGKCAAVLSSESIPEGIPCVHVEDTLKAYGSIAREYKKTLPVRTVAITGSVGKTTTKEMTAAVLAGTYRTIKTPENHNNHIGLPETVLTIEPDTEYAVVEMGMNHFGEISYLTRIAHPDIAVITNIGTMHIENLGSREGILKAKLEILEGVPDGGTVVLNGDDPMLWNLRGQLKQKTVYFGKENKDCDVYGHHILAEEDRVSFRATGFGRETELLIPTPGRHNVNDALAAYTVGMLCGVTPDAASEALAHYQNTGMRQKIIEFSGVTIIADCYNAGPESTEAALNMMKERPCKGKRIAVLADMLELGNVTNAEHYKIGRIAARTVDMLFAYGESSKRTVSGAITGGMTNSTVYYFETPDQLVRMLKNRVRNGDLILFKGSHGMHLERMVEMFMKQEQ